ncbi:MAG: hypothetical protein L6R36_001292 [Xanthoria steineri]|nr:MAG: hypothetical protein L6R36_001292 [Xanthoria steineri]
MAPFSTNRHRMTASFSSALKRGRAFLTPTNSSTAIPRLDGSFSKAPEGKLFHKVDPALDGEDCDHDCESCSIKYPAKFKIDEDDKLYGHVNAWATHMLVATGKTDWVRDVSDEKGSVMEAVRDCGVEPSNGKLMLSASNMPLPHEHQSPSDPTTILLLPSFTIIENVSPSTVPNLIKHHIDPAPTSTTPFASQSPDLSPPNISGLSLNAAPPIQSNGTSPSPILSTPSSPFTTRPCPHKYLILLCSQKTRDARCGQSAPLLRREFERHLRPLGLYRDLHDERSGGVGIYFISHVGGHKYSANLMIYRRGEVAVRDEVDPMNGNGSQQASHENTQDQVRGNRAVETGPIDGSNGTAGGEGSQAGTVNGQMPSSGHERETNSEGMGEGNQCIWLARVRPEDCEGIVKHTILKGKVIKPERQLRGGFDRQRGLVSW